LLATTFNPDQAMIERYEDLIRTVAFRYGENSQGIVFVLYDELIALRTVLAERPAAVPVRAWARSVADRLAKRYREDFVAPPNAQLPCTVVATEPLVVEFSRAAFEQKYRAAVPAVAPDTYEITGPENPELIPGRPYMFVVDDTGRFLVWKRPFNFDELVFGRNRATVAGIPVAHPMLVPERLRATAAGEIVFVGAPRVSAVIVNTKSGHFRLPPATAPVIYDKCRSVLGLTDEAIDVFLVGGNDGAAADRR
jgi:hypothetical protein